jgi:hypothetical protein
MSIARSSWAQTLAAFRGLKGPPGTAATLSLAERMADWPEASQLRAGISMGALVLSATHETLGRISEPSIQVTCEPSDGQLLRIEYVGETALSQVARATDADEVVRSWLPRLYSETSNRIGDQAAAIEKLRQLFSENHPDLKLLSYSPDHEAHFQILDGSAGLFAPDKVRIGRMICKRVRMLSIGTEHESYSALHAYWEDDLPEQLRWLRGGNGLGSVCIVMPSKLIGGLAVYSLVPRFEGRPYAFIVCGSLRYEEEVPTADVSPST